jgi:hypothetical protein
MKKAKKPSYQGAMKAAQSDLLLRRKEFLAELKKPDARNPRQTYNAERAARISIRLELSRLRWMLVEIAKAVGVFKK